MLKLFQPPRMKEWKSSNVSPACLKLETWLRMTGIPYEVVSYPYPVPPPKGKSPFIDDGGTLIGDSTLIIEHLKRTRGVDPDGKLSPTERAIGTAFRRMCKENLYWGGVQAWYGNEEGWKSYVSIWKPELPALLSAFGIPLDKEDEFLATLRKGFLDQFYGHGLGRHNEEEIYQILTEDVRAISTFLGDKPFFFGDEPVGVDATIYAYVTVHADGPPGPRLREVARSTPNLMEYCRRMRLRFFGDLFTD